MEYNNHTLQEYSTKLLMKAKKSEHSSVKPLSHQEVELLVDTIRYIESRGLNNLSKESSNILYTCLYALARSWSFEYEKLLADYYLGKKSKGSADTLFMTTMYLITMWQRYDNDEYMRRLIDIISASEENPLSDDEYQFVKDTSAKTAAESYLYKFPNGKYANQIRSILRDNY